MDGVPVKEKEFTETVIGFCGGDTEKPKMLTMPDYFPEQLAWDTRRKILLEICGDISDDEIIAENDELKELKDFLRMNGTAEQYYTTDEYKKVAASRRTEINRQLTEIPARIDEATQAIPDTTGLNSDEIEQNVASLQRKRDSLAAEKAEAAAGGTASATLRTQIADIRTKMAEGKAAHIKAQSDQNSNIDADILLAKREANERRREAEDARIDIRHRESETERIETLRSKLLGDYNDISGEVWDESKSVCPTCHQQLPAEQIERMREEFNLRKSQRLEEINKRGKTEASKTAIAELKAQIADLQKKAENAEEMQRAAEAKAEELAKKRIAPTAYETTEEYTVLTAQIADIEAKLNDENKCTAEAVAAVESEMKAVDEAIREERDKQMQLTMYR